MKLRPFILLSAAVALASACARYVAATRAAPATAAAPPFDASRPLTGAEQRWVDSVLTSLPLRDRVGQMVMVWVLGDYTSNGDSSFAEVRRWIQQDHIGGVSMSLGTPIEGAAEIKAMQRLSRVPLIASAHLQPGVGRAAGGLFSPHFPGARTAAVLPR